MTKELKDLFELQDKVTLKDLAKTGLTFWRFSQSEPGRSVEPYFEQYIPGIISTAKNSEKKLYFVDLNDRNFQAIENCEVKRVGYSFEEYECDNLLPAENYSLEDLDTLKMLIQMTKSHVVFVSMCANDTNKGKLWQVLKSYGFTHSSNVMKQIRSKLDRQPNFTQEEALELINKYIKEYL